MMRRRLFPQIAILAALTLAPALAQSVSLVGSLHTTSGGPISGANIYVTQAKDAAGKAVNGSEVGPVASSGSGQFVFYNLSPGEYRIRIVVSGTTVWQGTAHAPGQLSPIVLH
jgi:hypothetical protein